MGIWTPGPAATGGNDTFNGDGSSEVASGLGGDDTLFGNAGDDTLSGDDGNDELIGGSGADTLHGGIGNDSLDGGLDIGATIDTLMGGAGDDTYTIRNPEDVYVENADEGVDTLVFFLSIAEFDLRTTPNFENLTIDRPAGNLAVIAVGNDADNIIRANFVTGGMYTATNDTLSGGGGDDDLFAGAGDDLLNGDAGDDTLSGGDGADSLNGGADSDNVSGGEGNDIITGGLGADTLVGGAGNDTFRFFAGDILAGELIRAGDGNDDLQDGEFNTIAINGVNDFRVAEARGIHAVTFETAGAAYFALMSTEPLGDISLATNLTVTGSAGADSLYVDTGAVIDLSAFQFVNWSALDHVYITVSALPGGGNVTGSSQADYIGGAGGTINGGGGDDTLVSGGGADILNGGDGNDELRVFASLAAEGETLSGGNGIDSIVMAGSFDFSADTITSVERLVFGFETNLETALTATFNAGNLPITNVAGSSAADRIVIIADEITGGADLHSWVFTNWSANDQVVFISGDGDDDFVGHDGTDIMIANGLFDFMEGRGGDDYIASAGNVPQALLGGSGFNTLVVLKGLLIDDAESEFDGYYRSSFTGMQIAGINALNFGAPVGIENDLSVDKIFDVGSAQIESGNVSLILQVRGVDGQNDVIEINMSGIGNISVGNWTFSDWNSNGSGINPAERDLIVFRGNDNANSLGGSTRVDWMFGGGGNDFLLGELGDDVIDGGDGRDTAVFNASTSNATWQRTLSGAWTVTSADGVDTVRNVEFLRFDERDVFLDRAYSTLSGDGTSDIFMRHSSGALGVWFVNGSSVTGAAGLGVIDNSWAMEGVGDFNGDGRDDILMRHSNGSLGTWFMDGAAATGAANLGGIDGNWDIVGIGDLNRDGFDDIVMWNANGSLGVWFFNNGAVGGAAGLGNISQASWDFEGLGDFNGDGRDDILWRNSAGDAGIWFMNGGAATGAGIGNIAMSWTIEGTGDFDGDGRDDILMRDSSGNLGAWFMNGASATGVGLGNVSTDFAVSAIGDYNGDGRDDILWWHNNGSLGAWFMNGAAASATSYGAVSHDWVLNPGG